jgi:hypothetical protein
VVVWVLLILVGATGALLSVPVDLSFRVQNSPSWRVVGVIRWLFGVVKYPLAPGGGRRKHEHKRRKTLRKRRLKFGRLVREAAFRRRFPRFVQDVIASIQLLDFRARLRLGFEDPADTGLLWALVGPLMVFLRHTNIDLDVRPEFSESRMEIDLQGLVRVTPARLAWVLAVFALSPGVRRAISRSRVPV